MFWLEGNVIYLYKAAKNQEIPLFNTLNPIEDLKFSY